MKLLNPGELETFWFLIGPVDFSWKNCVVNAKLRRREQHNDTVINPDTIQFGTGIDQADHVGLVTDLPATLAILN